MRRSSVSIHAWVTSVVSWVTLALSGVESASWGQSLCALKSTEKTDLMKCVGSTRPSFTVMYWSGSCPFYTFIDWHPHLWVRLCVSRLCENLTVLQGSSSLGTCGEGASVTSTVSLPHHLSLYPTGVHRGDRSKPMPQLEPRLLFFNNTSNI